MHWKVEMGQLHRYPSRIPEQGRDARSRSRNNLGFSAFIFEAVGSGVGKHLESHVLSLSYDSEKGLHLPKQVLWRHINPKPDVWGFHLSHQG